MPEEEWYLPGKGELLPEMCWLPRAELLPEGSGTCLGKNRSFPRGVFTWKGVIPSLGGLAWEGVIPSQGG